MIIHLTEHETKLAIRALHIYANSQTQAEAKSMGYTSPDVARLWIIGLANNIQNHLEDGAPMCDVEGF